LWGIDIPHPSLVNLLIRKGLLPAAKRELSYEHELGYLQMLPFALLATAVLLVRAWQTGQFCWSRLPWLWAGHYALWEILAEGYVKNKYRNWRCGMAIKTIVLEVIGDQTIHCQGCENTIRRGLKQLPGVRRVEPSHKTQRIELTLDTDQTTLDAACDKLNWMGWQTRHPEEASA